LVASIATRRIDRRNLLRVGGGGLAALALLKTPGLGGSTASAASATAAPAAAGVAPGPLAWVWRFKEDGSPEAIRSLLAEHGVGVLLKVFDGTSWMARYDQSSPMPMRGPESVRAAADFFESAGVPFHAWCVVNGHDPITEARMASQVLDAGARTITFDLELPEGTNYWQAGPAEARILGEEMRRLQPNAYLSVAPDARPWQVESLPMAEFAAFCNDICPQTYWHIFDTPANHRLLARHGFPVGPDGVTPELILDATMASLGRHGKPVRPIGQGNSNAGWWQRFADHANRLGMSNLSTWRFGNTAADVWPVLSSTNSALQVSAPVPEPEPEPVVVAEPEPVAITEQPAAPVAEVQPAAGTQSSSITPPLGENASQGDLKETLSARTTSTGKKDWQEKLAEILKNHKPFGIGGGK